MSQPIRSLELAARRKDAEDAKNFREALEKIATGHEKAGHGWVDMERIAREALKASKGGTA
jgi:hypothetical protein